MTAGEVLVPAQSLLDVPAASFRDVPAQSLREISARTRLRVMPAEAQEVGANDAWRSP
jgi:hypothetical protein